jgi:hypothetical protein
MNPRHSRLAGVATAVLFMAVTAPSFAGSDAATSPSTTAKVSPHVRAARARALARAELPQQNPRVSPYGASRKPHKPAAKP